MKALTFILSLLFLTGCASEFNPATKRQESVMYGDDKESSIGAGVALQVEKQMKMNMEVDANERAQHILDKIVAVSDRKDLVYTIGVIDEDDMNAFSLPGGYIYLNKGLMDRVKDDELAAVIAHEVAHVTAKHSMKRLQGAYGATVLQGLAIASGSGAMAAGVGLTSNSLLFQNSREDEFEADRLGVRYMKAAGYDPSKMKTMLQKLLEYQAKQPPRQLSYWRTHPFLPQRMAQAAATARGSADFKDYLNITGEEK
jgi:predicted Zn-dependent protease